MTKERYDLNKASVAFLDEYTKQVDKGHIVTNKDLRRLFNESRFYSSEVESYYRTARQKALWYAVHKNDQWTKLGAGNYQRV